VPGSPAVQLNDGPLVHDDFRPHARAQRRLPGDGDLRAADAATRALTAALT
jgi:hypothetical protein